MVYGSSGNNTDKSAVVPHSCIHMTSVFGMLHVARQVLPDSTVQKVKTVHAMAGKIPNM